MKFTLKITLGNDAMRTRDDVATVLRVLADKFAGEMEPWDETDAFDRNGRIVDANGNGVGKWEARADETDEPVTARHTTCKYCASDIEGVAPFKRGQWRDRGNNRHCNDGKHTHAPLV